jgi:aspartyl-tRNA(Asn)/glutamyl-tRNA(Gln) amidotransferase subunit C
MSIQRSDVEKVAGLARLQLGREEVERLTRDCQAILDYFETVRGAEADGGRPTRVPDRSAPLREDRPDSEPLERPLEQIAPAWREGYFTLPRLPAMDGNDSAEDES